MSWVPICAYDELPVERGVTALVRGTQLAIIRIEDGTVFAVSHRDPFSNANVIARGLIGTVVTDSGDIATVHSPMYKQAFNLRTGECLSDPSASIGSWQVRINQGMVEVGEMCSAPTPPHQQEAS